MRGQSSRHVRQQGTSVTSDDASKTNPIVVALAILCALGLIGFVVVLIVKNTTALLPLGPAIALGAGFMTLMVGSAFSTALVPNGPRNAYVASVDGGAPESIPEFRASEAAVARVRRIVVLSTMWLAFAVWLLLWTISFTVLIRVVVVDPVADISPALTLNAFYAGTVALGAYTVLRTFMAPLTSQGAHLRALHDALPGAVIRPNRTSSSVAMMAKTTAPGFRVRASGDSYVAIWHESLTVWDASKGRLAKVAEVPLASITKVDYATVTAGLNGLRGVIVTTNVLAQPLEVCPVEHLVDFGGSADRFGRLLPLSGPEQPQGDSDRSTRSGS